MCKFRPRLLTCCAAVLLVCTACTPVQPLPPVSASPEPSLSEPVLPELSAPEVLSPDTTLPDEPSVPTLFVPEPTPVKDPTPVNAPKPEEPKAKPLPPDATHSQYDFSQPVPEQEPVDMSYFSTAAFVGDSRSEGFYLYGVKRGKNLSSSGLSVFTFTQKKAFTIGGKSYTGLQALALKDYERVYLGFGVNELGYVNTEKFYRNYCATIEAVRACQPYAVVYAQTMAPVNESLVAATGGAKHLNNERVRLYNDLIRQAAQEMCVPLLDIYAALEVDGSLPANASRDGIHINREYCQKQLDYLTRHTVDFDTLYPQPEPEVPTNETMDLPADGTADADSLLSQPDQSSLPAGGDPAATGN